MTAYVSAPLTLAHTTDATFQAWVAAIDAGMLAAGWGAATDTGQLDIANAVRPTVASTYAGSRTYYLNDSLFATDPIYVQLRFGTGAALGNPALTVKAGQGTNGTNTLTGNSVAGSVTLFGANPWSAGAVVGGSTLDGYGCLWVRANAAAGSDGIGWFITREFGPTDAPLPGRHSVTTLIAAASGAILNVTGVDNGFGPASTFGGGANSCLVGGGQANSPSATTVELYRHVAPLPECVEIPSLMTYRSGEVTRWSDFQLVPGSSVQRTYKALGFKGASVTGGATHALAAWHQ